MKKLIWVIAALLVSSTPATAQYCWNCDWEGTVCITSTYGVAGCTGACIVWGSCGLAGGCFLAGTLVSTPSGQVPIEFLETGDLVLAAYPNGRTEPVTIVDTIRVLEDDYYIINDKLRVTGTHPFKVGDEWKVASKLEVGDNCILTSGEVVTVSSIGHNEMGVRAYNISVEWPNTFFAEGWLVHNKPPIPGS